MLPSSDARPRGRATEALLHPIVLVALAVWILNDHWAKATHPSVLTGKLSDITSLIVFPLLPVAALEIWRARRKLPMPGTAWRLGWLLATGLVMATINLFDAAAWAYQHGLGLAQWPLRATWSLVSGHGIPGVATVRLTMDPTDLLTLPALVIPWLLQRVPPRPVSDPSVV